MEVLGIDIGSRTIKSGLVETATGEMLSELELTSTPQPASQSNIVEALKKTMERFDWAGPVGVGFPGVVLHSIVKTAPNLHPSVIGLNLEDVLMDLGAFEVCALNEADAAGIGEIRMGSGRNQLETILLVTIETGMGSALFHKGRLIPNTEFGHFEFRGGDAETLLSNRARLKQKRSWKDWANDLNGYLNTMAALLSTDLVILGGEGVLERENFEHFLALPCELKFAKFGKEAGVVGAALSVDF